MPSRAVPTLSLITFLLASAGCDNNNLIGELDGETGVPGLTIDAGNQPDGSDAFGAYDAVGDTASAMEDGRDDAGAGGADAGERADAISGDEAAGSGGGCPITYPPSGFFGPNILYPQATPFATGVTSPYTMAAIVPLGYALTLKLTNLGGTGVVPGLGPTWALTQDDFRESVFNKTTHEQIFEARLVGINEVEISFEGTGSARIDFFECGSITPTKTETIYWAQ